MAQPLAPGSNPCHVAARTPLVPEDLSEQALARVHGGGRTTETAQLLQFSLQNALQRYQQTYATLANILRKLSSTSAQIAQNLR